MTNPLSGISRRRFLSGLAVLGVTPVFSSLEAWPAWAEEKQWTGDNFDEAHERQRNPYAWLRAIKERTDHPPCDAIIIGGGISGLTVAYKLRDRNIVLLERESQTGGVSKSCEWKGIQYSLGTAYMLDPRACSPADDSEEKWNWELLRELNLTGDFRSATEHDGCIFTDKEVVPQRTVYSEQNEDFFKTVACHENYPAVPPEDTPQARALVNDLDRISFKEFLKNPELQKKLYGQTVGAISAEGREAIEYYFWGTFGTTTWETSAYHGLNFFAAEFTKLMVFPGGNAFIAKRLDDRIRAASRDILQTGHYVLLVEPRSSARGYVVSTLKNDQIHRYSAPVVVFAAPLFLAKTLIPSLPDEQKRAIASFDYRSFVVANVLLDRPMSEIFSKREKLREGYELRHILNADVDRDDPYILSSRGVFTDVVAADYAKRDRERAVLTLYRPYPYAHGRDRLRYLTYEHVEEEIRDAVFQSLSAHGLRKSDIAGIRLTRWGHPMIISRPGQLADGVLEKAAKSGEGLFFSHTDVSGAPSIEGALAAAHEAVNNVTSVLAH